MSLEPITAALLAQMAQSDGPRLEAMLPEQAREMYRALQPAAPHLPVARVEDRRIPGPNDEIPIRIYWPDGEAPFPVHVFFHGGGWTIGDLDTHDAYCRELCRLAGSIVLAVDYRRAPEHPFPAAPEDCYAAVCWAAEHAASFDGDAARLSVGGDSAGGNLSAVVTLMIRERGGPELCFQLLVYPATDTAMDTVSHEENGEGYLLTRGGMTWFIENYCPDVSLRVTPYVSPLRAADLSGLPPAFVITAEFDPLRDEGEAYARRLAEAGVAAEYRRFDGMIHGFLGMLQWLPAARPALEQAAAALRAASARRTQQS